MKIEKMKNKKHQKKSLCQHVKNLLCISTSFRVLRVELLFSAVFRDFRSEINEKHLKINKKTVFSIFVYFSKLVEIQTTPWFFCSFFDIFQWFQTLNHWKSCKKKKKVENSWKKVVWPPFGCAQHPKVGQNTQQIMLTEAKKWSRNLLKLSLLKTVSTQFPGIKLQGKF